MDEGLYCMLEARSEWECIGSLWCGKFVGAVTAGAPELVDEDMRVVDCDGIQFKPSWVPNRTCTAVVSQQLRGFND